MKRILQSLSHRVCQGGSYGLFLLLLIIAPIPLHADEVTLSLPLQGHYRVGRYMPVHVSAKTDAANDRLTLRATGALTTVIESNNGHVDGIFPWLAIRRIRDVRWSTAAGEHSADLPLQALDEDDRLIGYAGADPDALAPLFHDKNLIRVGLDVTDPLPGNIAAWESLDGLVLDAAAARRPNTEAAVQSLLAGGTAIAIKSTSKPGGGWAWQRHGAYWIVRADIAGPTSSYKPEAYEPTEIWIRGWPATFRRQVILVAIIFLILATGATLWRSRWAVVLAMVMCGIATGGVLLWRHRHSPKIEAGGSIIILTDTTTQRDDWSYQSTLRETDGLFDFRPLCRPVFAARDQAGTLDARQICAADGRIQFRYHLLPLQSLAFQSRSLVSNRATFASTTPITSMLRGMADKLYAMKDDRLTGQIDDNVESHWPDVVIDRRAASSDSR